VPYKNGARICKLDSTGSGWRFSLNKVMSLEFHKSKIFLGRLNFYQLFKKILYHGVTEESMDWNSYPDTGAGN
jgi:hypothetical protein